MRFGACIDTLYTHLPWYERFAAAKADGFDAVEFWDWRALDLARAADCAARAGILISGFNGDGDYSPVDASQRAAYLSDLQKSIQAAKKLGAPSLTVHSNALGEGGRVVNAYADVPAQAQLDAMRVTLKEAAKMAEDADILLNLEALNTHVDHVGNFLASTSMAAEVCEDVGSPNLKILYDVYHMQINEGNLCDHIRQYIRFIGHVHIADVPGRHEPGTGEIFYPAVLRCLRDARYQGIVGCELFPLADNPAAIRAIMDVRRQV